MTYQTVHQIYVRYRNQREEAFDCASEEQAQCLYAAITGAMSDGDATMIDIAPGVRVQPDTLRAVRLGARVGPAPNA